MKTLARLSLFFAIFSCANSSLFSQITVEEGISAQEAVEDVLLGAGIVASNITYSGQAFQMGSFTGSNESVDMAAGLILSTGEAGFAEGPNDQNNATSPNGDFGGPGDADLTDIADLNTNDAAVLEFDFIPTGDSLMFNYVFSSDEYMTYANGSINDAFAFILTGVTTSYPATNIAVLPGSDPALPITLNNVNADNNAEFYQDNGDPTDGFGDPIEPFFSDDQYLQYDGMTIKLAATANVICGETYHIKLAIADGSDGIIDSAVFIEAGSFSSNLIEVAITGLDLQNDSTTWEGCTEGSLTFTRPADSPPEESSFELIIGGTADNGGDCTEIPTLLTFPENEYDITMPFEIFQDNINEGTEFISITFSTFIDCIGESIVSTTNIYFIEPDPLVTSLDDYDFNCDGPIVLEPLIEGGTGGYLVEWSNGMEGESITIPPEESFTISYTVTDQCIGDVSSSAFINIPVNPPIVVDLGVPQELDCTENLNAALVNVSGGNEVFTTYTWMDSQGVEVGNGQNMVYNDTFTNWSDGFLELHVADECGYIGVGTVYYSFPPIPVFIDFPQGLQANCNSPALIIPSVTGGANPIYTYEWTDFEDNILGNDPTLSVSPSQTSVYSLRVEDECGNIQTGSVEVFVPEPDIFLEITEDFSICKGEDLALNVVATGGFGGNTYDWAPIGEVGPSLIFEAEESETYTVTVVDQCGNSQQAMVAVDVVDFNADFDFSLVEGYQVDFVNTSTPLTASTFWNYGDGDVSTDEHPTHVFTDLEPHVVSLYAEHPIGCLDSAKWEFFPPMDVYIPTGFTPNGDGINDYFVVQGHEISEFEIEIYNRWGEVVFATNSIQEPWNGSHENGDYYTPSGTYAYRIRVKGVRGEKYERSGSISLIR